MWSRRSSTSTFSPRSAAQRSAIVRPKKPDPTMTRSGFNTHSRMGKQPTVYRPGVRVLARPAPPGAARSSRRPAASPGRDQRPVGDAAHPLGHQPVPAPDDDVADVLGPGGDPELAEAALHRPLGAQQPPSPAPGVRTGADPVADERLGEVRRPGPG